MKWIGLTGCMGCGKSTVARLLKTEYGLEVVSADEVALSLLKEDKALHDYLFEKMGISPPEKSLGNLSDSDEAFEDDFLRYRAEIAEKVFKNPMLLKGYESFFHPRIKNKVLILKKELSLKFDVAIYDVPLLFEKNMEADFDAIVGVFANPDVQLERIKNRNQWSDEEIKNRLKHQVSNDLKIKKCDFVITNNSNLEDLKIQVALLVAKLSSH
jgi:dephospho-CoA kinase